MTRNSPLIDLRLFGPTELRTVTGAKAHGVLAQSKHVGFLAIAASARRSPVRRDRVVGLLWPELDEDRARNALSKAIHNCRRALGEDALVGRFVEEIGLDVDHWSIDLWDFEDAVERGDYADALELYRRGAWMDGFHIPDASAFEHWMDGERERLRRRACDAATALADSAERAGDAVGAAEHLRLLGDLNPFDERVLRRRLTLLDRNADRAAALSAFTEFSVRLQRELDTSPSPETIALLEAIRRREGMSADVTPRLRDQRVGSSVAVRSQSGIALPTSPQPLSADATLTPRAVHGRRATWFLGGTLALLGIVAIVLALAPLLSSRGAESDQTATVGDAVSASVPFAIPSDGVPMGPPMHSRTNDSKSRGAIRPEERSADSILKLRRDYRTVILLMGSSDARDSTLQRQVYKVVESMLARDTLLRILGAAYVTGQLRDARVPEAYVRDRDTIAANARFMGHAISHVDVSRFGGGFSVSINLRRTDRTKPIATYTGVAADSATLPDVLGALVDSTTRTLREVSSELTIAVNSRLYSPAAVQLFYDSNTENNAGNYLVAVDLARAAIRADSNYLGAWSALMGYLSNAGLNRAEQVRAATKTYELRHRGPLSGELWWIARWYRARGLLDSAYAAELARPGGNYGNFQGGIRRAQGENALAEKEFRRMVASAPLNGMDHQNLARTLIDQGKFTEYDSLVRAVEARPGMQRWTRNIRISRAVALHDAAEVTDRAQQILADSTTDTAQQLLALGLLRAARAMTGNISASDSLARIVQQRQDSLRDPGSALKTIAERASLLARTSSDASEGRRVLAEGIQRYSLARMEFMDRPYPALITAHARLGNLREANRLSIEWTRGVPALFSRVDAKEMADARGEVALAEGKPKDALRFFRAEPSGICAVCGNVNVARAFDAMGRADSAVHYFDRYLDTPSTTRQVHDREWLAYSFRRAGEIKEKRGDTKAALTRYEAFVALRAHADAPFAPEVDSVRSRLDRLRRP